jgi:predicted Zn-dependent protease
MTVDTHRRGFLRGCALCAAGAGLFSPLVVDAREGVEVGKESAFAKLVPAEEVEATARQQYQQMLKQAAEKKALGPDNHPEVLRLRGIAQRIIPHSYEWNPRAREWKWEVNLIGSNQVNAFCMPGGKIAFYYGILKKLNLSDDEVAMVMGHEVSHPLREHARERISREYGQNLLLTVGMVALGVSGPAAQLGDMLGQVTFSLPHGRTQETEADGMGLELMARAGYDPAAAVNVWRKMARVQQSKQAEFLSTHPSSSTRIADLQALLPKVTPRYEAPHHKG